MLADAGSVEGLHPVLAALGFEIPLEPVDILTRSALGIPAACRDVAIARGAGALRALVVRAPDHLSVRDAARRIATRLAASAPHILWLLIIADSAFAQLAIVAWAGDRKSPRLSALIIDRARVVDSDAETACALAAAHSELDALTHERWLEVLGRECITRRFYRTLERLVGNMARSLPPRVTDDDRSELALLCASRLLFLSFLQAKGWLDGDRGFLGRTFDECVSTGGSYHRRVLLPLLHGTLNTHHSARSPTARAFGRVPFLNGGLFARTTVERRHRTLLFPDDQIGPLFGDLLSRYRFTAREDSAMWSEAAIDPEMLGKAFESVMASRERRTTGAYFTPQALVERVTTAALVHGLRGAGFPDAVLDGMIGAGRRALDPDAALRDRLTRIRVVDPACGSGAFLVHALERVAAMHASLGDARDIVEVRRSVLTRTIFGVDRNPFAVWLCELRLWLSMVIESSSDDPRTVPPLPNLDHHIRVGDALAGEGLSPIVIAIDDAGQPCRARTGRTIARLRDRYVRATGPRKQSLARELDRRERAQAVGIIEGALEVNAARRRDLLAIVRTRDLFGDRRTMAASDARALRSLRVRARELRRQRRDAAAGTIAFSFATHFADADAAGGFDIVVGNPPWVRLQRIPVDTRTALRARFAVFRERGWDRGASAAHAGAGFAGQVDLAALFVERSLELLRPRGVLSLLLPSKLWHSLAGGALRRLILRHTDPVELDDLGESPHAFDAAVYPSILTAIRRDEASVVVHPHARSTLVPTDEHSARANGDCVTPPAEARPALTVTLIRRSSQLRWTTDIARAGFDGDPASPWLLLPPGVRAGFDRLTAAGTTLAESVLGRPYLGVKCGCNAAFIVTVGDEQSHQAVPGDTADIEAPGRRARVEREMLRPLLRGEFLHPWRIDDRASNQRILWPHDPEGAVLRALPPLARHWLLPWRRRLIARTDGGGRGHWWSLFRTDSARCDVPRVVWADLGRTPRAVVLDAGDPTVALNSCYVVRCPTLPDAHALAALLNGPLATAWLNALAEPARGGFRRYLGWTTALLPIPHDWERARASLSPVGARGCAGEVISTAELVAVGLEAYALSESDAEPLLTWMAR